MKRIKLLLILSLVLIFVFSCKKARMKYHKQKIERIEPINIKKEILKNDTIVTIVTTATYSTENFAKLEKQRKRWTKKKKDHGKNEK